MKILKTISWVAALLTIAFGSLAPKVLATAPALATPSGLSLAEIKITGSEFVMLQNNTGATIPDLSVYWLSDYNNINPLASGVSNSTQQLPMASLANGQTALLNSNGGSTCGAAVTARLSVGLTDSGGFLEVVQTSLVGGVVVQTAGDVVSWSSTIVGTIGSTVPSSSSDPNGAFYRYQNSVSPASYTWQKAEVDTSNTCQLDVSLLPAVANPGNQLLPGSPPPATIVAASASTGIPDDDIGLAAPQITELLPNPAGTGNDSTDEFVELYNPNDTAFDLSGFTIEVGLTTKHDYTFDAGSSLPPQAFAAFYSADTNLTLSNTGGQVWLLDPLGNIISQADAYASAKDGLAWALANGTWYWTSTPTPNALNLINGVAVGGSGSKTKTTPTVSTASVSSGSGSGSGSSFDSSSSVPAAPIHTWTLAVVGSAALLYAAYEYRADLANNLYRFRRYRAARAAAGKSFVPAGFGGTIGRLGRWQDNVRAWLGQRFKK